MSTAAPSDIAKRLATILGWKPLAWSEVRGGYTPAARYVVRNGSRSAFLKVATTPLTAEHMRREIAAYGAISGSFRPRILGACDDPNRPFIVIEDLGAAIWPPPWSRQQIEQVLGAAEEMHSASADLRPYGEVHGAREPGWRSVAKRPIPFLSLGLATKRWLDRSLPILAAAEASCPTEGKAPTHWDLRSDNICFDGDRAIFVDWGEACLSNPKLDLGFWLPSLAHEGGPLPEKILPNEPEIAAWVSGFFAARAGLPVIPDAPLVRRVQREQLVTSLRWVSAVLGLTDPHS